MRGASLVVMLVVLAPLAWATTPSVVFVDWQDGRFVAGAPARVEGVSSATLPLVVDACHRRVFVDLLYAPEETTLLDTPSAGLAFPHVFRAEVLARGAVVASATIRASGYGAPLGAVPAGEHQLRLSLAQGVDVSWSLRVRGWEVPGEPACLPRVVVSEVEADPAGPDEGREWVELLNLEAEDVDVSGWALAGPAGGVFLAGGSVVPAGGRLVVPFEGEPLPAAWSVELRRLGLVVDATPTLTDDADDDRSWQRGEPWTFGPASPGA